MFWAILSIAAFLTYLVIFAKVGNLLLSLLAGFSWLGLAFWAIIDSTSPFSDLTKGWNVIMVTIFAAMAFLPPIMQMQVEVVKEKNGHRWAERMNREELARMDRKPSVYESHMANLNSRIKTQKSLRGRR